MLLPFTLLLTLLLCLGLNAGALLLLAPRPRPARRLLGRAALRALPPWLLSWWLAFFAFDGPTLLRDFSLFRLCYLLALSLWLAGTACCFCCRRLLLYRGRRPLAALALVLAALGGEALVCNGSFFATYALQPLALTAADLSPQSTAEQMPDGSLRLTPGQDTLVFEGLSVEAHDLLLDCAAPAGQPSIAADIQLEVLDGNSAVTPISLPDWQVYLPQQQTKYYHLSLDGALTRLSLQFAAPEGQTTAEWYVYRLWVNVARPFAFSALRFLALLGGLCFLYGFRAGSRLWRIPLLAAPRGLRLALGAWAAGLALLFALLALSNASLTRLRVRGVNTQQGPPVWVDQTLEISDPYALLTQSLLQGRLSVDLPVSPALEALEDPYDPGLRQAHGLVFSQDYYWDHAYYQGQYFVYFGLTPLLLCYLPLALFGLTPDVACTVLLFGWLALAGSFALVYAAAARWFSRASVAVGALCGGLPPLLQRPMVYEQAQVSAYALLLWGLACAVWASKPCPRRRLWLFAAGCCLALVAGSRPQMLAFGLLLLPLFGREYLVQRRCLTRQGLAELACGVLPGLLFGLLLGAYNLARFGSPLDFGATYNLTELNMPARALSAGRLLQGVWFYLLQPPCLSGVFPFLQAASTATGFAGSTVFGAQALGGLLWTRPLLLVLALLPQKRRALARAGLLPPLLCCLGVSVFLMCADALVAPLSWRYFCDFSLGLLLAALLLLLFLEQRGAGRAGWRRLRGLLPPLVLLSGLLCLLAIPASNSYPLRLFRPDVYYSLQRLTQFWV